MRLSLCVFGSVGYRLLSHCAAEDPPIELVIFKSSDPWAPKIIKKCKYYDIPHYSVKNINKSDIATRFQDSSIDICLLLWWPDIIKSELLRSVNIGFINLHPSLLPYNRGMNPYYWSIVDSTPAGVSIHFIDAEIDGGSVLYQKEIETSITTTGQELYHLNEEAIIQLFKERYYDIINTVTIPPALDVSNHPVHYKRDLETHSKIDLDKHYTGREIIDIIRARTFDSGNSAYFLLDDKKYFVRINIVEDKNGN